MSKLLCLFRKEEPSNFSSTIMHVFHTINHISSSLLLNSLAQESSNISVKVKYERQLTLEK